MEQTAESIFMDPYWIWPIVLCSVVFFLAIFIGVLWYLSTQTNHDVGSPVEKTSLLVVRDKLSYFWLKCFQSPAEQMLISSPDDSSGRSNYSPLVRIVELDTICNLILAWLQVPGNCEQAECLWVEVYRLTFWSINFHLFNYSQIMIGTYCLYALFIRGPRRRFTDRSYLLASHGNHNLFLLDPLISGLASTVESYFSLSKK